MVEGTDPSGSSARNAPSATTIVRDEDNDEESDADLSEPDEELTSQGTDDTQVVSELNAQGMAHYDDAVCLVELSQRVKGHALLCGHPRSSCTRPKHRELQRRSGPRGEPGYYQRFANARGTAYDAILDTFMSPQAWIEQRTQNRALLSQLGREQSPGKAQMEAALKPKSTPMVRIDTAPRGPRATLLQTWAKDLPVTPPAEDVASPTQDFGMPQDPLAAPVMIPTTIGAASIPAPRAPAPVT
jgi:hypothetical protein